MKITMSDRPRDRVKLYAGFITIVEALDTESRGRLFLAIMRDANGLNTDGIELQANEYIAFLAYKSQQAGMEASCA